MINEVKYSNFAETTQQVNAVDLDTFIRLFVNHRPVYGIGKNNIEEAFEALLGEGKKEGGTITRGKYYLSDFIRGTCHGFDHGRRSINRRRIIPMSTTFKRKVKRS